MGIGQKGVFFAKKARGHLCQHGPFIGKIRNTETTLAPHKQYQRHPAYVFDHRIKLDSENAAMSSTATQLHLQPAGLLPVHPTIPQYPYVCAALPLSTLSADGKIRHQSPDRVDQMKTRSKIRSPMRATFISNLIQKPRLR